MPEVEEGDDVAQLIASAAGGMLRDRDVVVVTQKIVSKAEGRLVPEGDPAIGAEVRRVVARREGLLIAETRHGFVCANAGADRSNLPEGFVSLLPEDPDSSAERLRKSLASDPGVEVGVVVTDTFGRAWRRGVLEVAIGVAGLPALVDLRGTRDAVGRTLEATTLALADAIAAAAGLGMPKSAGIPVAIVRGVDIDEAPGAAADLVRPAEEDLFRWGPLEAISSRRSVRAFTDQEVPFAAVEEAVAAALTAPVPHGSRHRQRPWLWIVLMRGESRDRLLAAMASAWEQDLRGDGVDEATISRRLERSRELLGSAPVLALPALRLDAADSYPDERRRTAEREMFLLATGAAVQNFMLALHAQGVASCWVSSTLFCKDEVREAVGLEEGWLPMGAVVAGIPETDPPPRPPVDPTEHVRLR